MPKTHPKPKKAVSKKKSYTIEVTQEDIIEGIPGFCDSCPIALAARRTFPGQSIRVFEGEISVVGGGPCRSFATTKEADKFIRDFDKRKSVQPFTFAVKES